MRDVQFLISKAPDLMSSLAGARRILVEEFGYDKTGIGVIACQVIPWANPPKIQGAAPQIEYITILTIVGENESELIPYTEIKKKTKPD